MTISLQPIPYQGSKRNIAKYIMVYAPSNISRLVEPFAGSAAITLYSSYYKLSNSFLINDSYLPLMELWRELINNPEKSASEYQRIWTQQLASPYEYYFKVREEFNRNGDPIKLLYLVARCVKNAIRFNSKGQFNQGPDKRRLGRNPRDMRVHILSSSILLRGKTAIMSKDYRALLDSLSENDFVYMDPPYQGTSEGSNPRYHQGVDFNELIRALKLLNTKNVPFLLSYDGQLGEKIYGKPIPEDLGLKKINIHAGRSAQATLNGKDSLTIESLYISPNIKPDIILQAKSLYTH